MTPRYKVTLTKEERQELQTISTKGKRDTRTVLHARALLLLDAGELLDLSGLLKKCRSCGNDHQESRALKKAICRERHFCCY